MYQWIVLIPPLLVFTLAVITQRVLFSLFFGIVASGLIITNFSLKNTLLFLFNQFSAQIFDSSNLYTFAFLITLGMLISLITASGGTLAYGKAIKNVLQSRRSAKFSSIMLSLFFMIDDFFSCLTVGCIMRPLTDSFKIPRVKLAFLIDSLAAPLVILVPISTWIAMLLMQLEKAGISTDTSQNPIFFADPFITYLRVIPFVFYSFIILFSVWFIVYRSISFGFMRKHEIIAENTGNLFGGKQPLFQSSETVNEKGTLFDFILPIGSLIACILLALLYTGNSALLGGTNNFLETIRKADIYVSLFLGTITAFIINCIRFVAQKKLYVPDLKQVVLEGFFLMIGSIQILFLAWTFSSILKNNLQTGQYIAQLLIGSVPSFLFPCLFFIASLITAIATGSSWGTIAVMIPLAIPMIGSFFDITQAASIDTVPLLLPLIGSIFAGAVAGDHVSPIGTTTVMSATSAGAYLEDHVWTQLPYAAPALIGTTIAYFIAGMLITTYSWWITVLISLFTGIATSLIGLVLLNHYFKKN
jgi:Na+/H+ antiporter NhaC